MNISWFSKKTPVEINQMLAERIRVIRKNRKFSQEKLSEKSGVSLGSVKRFEQTGEISLLSFTKIVYALELENELLQLFEETKPRSIEEILNEQGK